MTEARIYQPAKTAMQSGRGNTGKWVLEFEPVEAKRPDPLMGWAGSGDMNGQVRMRFDSKESAIAFAEKKGLVFRVQEAMSRRILPKNYAAIFGYHRPF